MPFMTLANTTTPMGITHPVVTTGILAGRRVVTPPVLCGVQQTEGGAWQYVTLWAYKCVASSPKSPATFNSA